MTVCNAVWGKFIIASPLHAHGDGSAAGRGHPGQVGLSQGGAKGFKSQPCGLESQGEVNGFIGRC